jgi:hypothetical protein
MAKYAISGNGEFSLVVNHVAPWPFISKSQTVRVTNVKMDGGKRRENTIAVAAPREIRAAMLNMIARKTAGKFWRSVERTDSN